MDGVKTFNSFFISPHNRSTWCDVCATYLGRTATKKTTGEGASFKAGGRRLRKASPVTVPLEIGVRKGAAFGSPTTSAIASPAADVSMTEKRESTGRTKGGPTAPGSSARNSKRAMLNRQQKQRLVADFRMVCMNVREFCVQCLLEGDEHSSDDMCSGRG